MSSNKQVCQFDTMKAAELLDSRSEKLEPGPEEEEKQILTAWKRLQHSLSVDPAGPGPPQSFLAKQRLLTRVRRRRSTLQEPRYESCGEQKSRLKSLM